MNPDLPWWCGRLLSAAGTGIYQGLALTAVIWLGLRLLPRTNAATRHAVAMATLVMVAGLPLVYLIAPSEAEESASTSHPAARRVETNAEENGEPEMALATTVENGRGDSEPGIAEAFVQPETDFSTMPAFTPVEAATDWAPEPQGTGSDPAFDPGGSLSAEPVSVPDGEDSRAFGNWPGIPSHLGFALPDWIVVALVGTWGLLGSIRLLFAGWQCWRLHMLKRNGKPAGAHLQGRFQEILRDMKVRRRARLITSREIAAPMAAGYFRPAVLLPQTLLDQAQVGEIEPLLRHEAAHLVRWDDWSNLVQQLIRAAYFFHPGVWWLSRRLTLEREIACDDHVLGAASSRKAYALLLTEFAGRMQAPDWEAAPAAWSRKSQLKERIGMILDQKRNTSTGLARSKVGLMAATGLVMAALGWQSAPRLVFAQEAAASIGVVASEDAVITSEDSTPARNKPARTTAIIRASEGLPGGARGGVRTVTAPAAEPPPAPRAVIQVAPAAPAVAEPAITLDLHGPVIAQAPRPPKPAAPPRKRGESLEERVARLERMIESLLEKEDGEVKWKEKTPKFESQFNWKPAPGGFGRGFHPDGKPSQPGGAGGSFHFVPDEKHLAQIHEHAERMAEQAARQAERMAMQFEFHGKFDSKREALEARKRALEQQMKGLERQMERLEGMLEEIEVEEELIEEEREVEQDVEPAKEKDVPDSEVKR